MLSFVPTPIGNLEDISFRSLKRLSEAEILFCEDTRVTKSLITLLKSRFDTKFHPDPEFISFHSHNENEVIATLEPEMFKKNVVFVSDAGMPAISDPAASMVKWCLKNGVEYEVLAGANAALTAYAASGESSGKFLFYGFLPHKMEAKREILLDLMDYPFSTVLYESPKRVLDLIDLIVEIDPAREVFVAKELTKKYEKLFFNTALEMKKTLINSNLNGEWCVVIYPNRNDRSQKNSWLIDELTALDAPIKPLSKILAKLTGEKSSAWYEKLLKAKS